MENPVFNTIWYEYKKGNMPFNDEGIPSEVVGDTHIQDMRFLVMGIDGGLLTVHNAKWVFPACDFFLSFKGQDYPFEEVEPGFKPLYWSMFVQDGIGEERVGYHSS